MPNIPSSVSIVTQIQCQLQQGECPPFVRFDPNESLWGTNASTPHGCLKKAHINHISQPHWQKHPEESMNKTQQRYHPVRKGCQGKLEEISPRFNFIEWWA